jgi:hypothetical protein
MDAYSLVGKSLEELPFDGTRESWGNSEDEGDN